MIPTLSSSPMPLLTLLLCIGALGAACAYLWKRSARITSLVTMLVLLVVAGAGFGAMFTLSSAAQNSYQLVERSSIVTMPLSASSHVQVSYHVGVDGISVAMVLLTIVLGIVAVLISRREIRNNEAQHHALLVLLVTAIIGVFISLDLVLLFVFWEAVLVITFLLILIWGGENRKYAAMKFLLFTGIGSALLLAAIIILGTTASADLAELGAATAAHEAAAVTGAAVPGAHGMLVLAFWLIVVACLIKMPIVPLHTWLPDAHVQAPTAGSILLAGVMLKMGAYLLLRVGIAMGDILAPARTVLFALGLVTIVYGALACLSQRNIKRIIAYSSIHHMGFVLIGIATASTLGYTGAAFEMVSHGLIAALLFGIAGLIHERRGTFDIDELRGLATTMPRTATLFVIGALAGLGLPTMTGFVAELLILLAAVRSFGLVALIALAGMILGGGYFLRLLSRAVFGTPTAAGAGGLTTHAARESDEHNSSARGTQSTTAAGEGGATGVHFLPFVLLTALIFILGILPYILITLLSVSVFSSVPSANTLALAGVVGP